MEIDTYLGGNRSSLSSTSHAYSDDWDGFEWTWQLMALLSPSRICYCLCNKDTISDRRGKSYSIENIHTRSSKKKRCSESIATSSRIVEFVCLLIPNEYSRFLERESLNQDVSSAATGIVSTSKSWFSRGVFDESHLGSNRESHQYSIVLRVYRTVRRKEGYCVW